MCALVRVCNSQHTRVDIMAVRDLSKEVYVTILEKFPFASLSPSVHRIIAHAWEAIELNGGYGLGRICEEGLEV